MMEWPGAEAQSSRAENSQPTSPNLVGICTVRAASWYKSALCITPLSKSTLLDQPDKIHINDQVLIALLAIYELTISQARMLKKKQFPASP